MRRFSRRRDDGRGWPTYLFGGRLRTSTATLVVVFTALFWVYQTYEPPPGPPVETQVVPPGFVPDPAYTWVPRTDVQTQTTTTETTTTTSPGETTTTSPGETTSPEETTAPGETTTGETTTTESPGSETPQQTTTAAPGP